MRTMKAYLLASAAVACIGVSAPAHAQNYAFGAGSTFAAIAYRSMMDCYYTQVQGSPGKPGPQAFSTACPTTQQVDANGNPITVSNLSGAGGEILYAPTGSGNGKAVLLSNLNTTITAPSASQTVPYTDTTINVNATTDYDGVQFSGSDDVVNASDIAKWNAAGNPAKFGNLYQIPAFIGPIAIGFNGTDGTGAALNIVPTAPPNGTSGLNLSRNALCGIASGHITQWNNPILTALNGGVLGTGNITFVHRSDGSGSTFLVSNALAAQCQFEFGPNSESDATVVSYAFPWTDRSSATSSCPYLPAHGADQLNWPDAFGGINQCGNAVANPGGGHFTQASGSGGVETTVLNTNGAIGYASADYWAPIKVGAPNTANLQSLWDLTTGNGTFEPPTGAGAATAMSSATPLFDSNTRLNPLAWSLQGVVPNPALAGSYPISGFTWLEIYQCYQVHTNGNAAFTQFRNWLDFLYGQNGTGTAGANILAANNFAPVPAAWTTEIYNLLTDATNGPAYVGNTTPCTSVAGAY